MKKVVKEKELAQIAEKIAKKLIQKDPSNGARVIALVGDLGAGKTRFVKHFLRSLGVKEEVLSPTFLIIKSYPLEKGNYTNAVHIDTYRIEDPLELLKLGFKELIAEPKNIVLIEWAERIKDLLPEQTIWIELSHQENDTRKIVLKKEQDLL